MKRPSGTPARLASDSKAKKPSHSILAAAHSAPTLEVAADVVVLEHLEAIRELLGTLEDSARVREMRAKAKSYERVTQQWAAVAPSAAQRVATLDLVTELHAKIAEIARPTLNLRTSRPPAK